MVNLVDIMQLRNYKDTFSKQNGFCVWLLRKSKEQFFIISDKQNAYNRLFWKKVKQYVTEKLRNFFLKIESPLKMIKNAFYSMLKAHFVLEIFTFSS